MTENISKDLVAQRMRNRTIEYLDWVRSARDHLNYERKVPFVSVTSEALEQWDDFMGERGINNLQSWLYTAAEMDALAAFHKVWEETSLPVGMSVKEALEHPSYQSLMNAANATYKVMMARGLLSDEILERAQ